MPRVAKTFNAPGLTASGEVLQTLKAAYPHGVSTLELVKKHGVAVKSRIGDLRLDGWDISTGERGGVAYYSLVSLIQGRPSRVLAGCTIRFDSRDGWTSRSHADGMKYGKYSPELLKRAEEAALRAYLQVLDPDTASTLALGDSYEESAPDAHALAWEMWEES